MKVSCLIKNNKCIWHRLDQTTASVPTEKLGLSLFARSKYLVPHIKLIDTKSLGLTLTRQDYAESSIRIGS